ncbi:hypothetical protein HN51_022400, partial [Arachis hypogaea]
GNILNVFLDYRKEVEDHLLKLCLAMFRYLENYNRALTGFEAATLKNSGLNISGEVQKIVNFLDK